MDGFDKLRQFEQRMRKAWSDSARESSLDSRRGGGGGKEGGGAGSKGGEDAHSHMRSAGLEPAGQKPRSWTGTDGKERESSRGTVPGRPGKVEVEYEKGSGKASAVYGSTGKNAAGQREGRVHIEVKADSPKAALESLNARLKEMDAAGGEKSGQLHYYDNGKWSGKG